MNINARCSRGGWNGRLCLVEYTDYTDKHGFYIRRLGKIKWIYVSDKRLLGKNLIDETLVSLDQQFICINIYIVYFNIVNWRFNYTIFFLKLCFSILLSFDAFY